jgi:DNA polymerase/3'-5' exonuclease PolX
MEYKQAKEIAVRIYKSLEPFCTRLEIAGSVRREKPLVKDIELVLTPRLTEVKDLFGDVLESKRNNEFVKTVKSLGTILKGDILTGRYVQIALHDGINLDIFIPVETDFYRQYSIRCGPADYSHKVLANAWLKKSWCGTENGLRLQSESYQIDIGSYPDGRPKKKWICNALKPTLPPVFQNEYEFFTWLQIPWTEPKNRNV